MGRADDSTFTTTVTYRDSDLLLLVLVLASGTCATTYNLRMSFPHTPETSDVDAIQGGTSLRRRSLLLSSLPWTTDCVMRPTLRDGFDAPADVPQVSITVSTVPDLVLKLD